MVYEGADIDTLRARAFEGAATQAGDQPASVLYITGSNSDIEAVREQWRDYGRDIELQVRSLDGIVDASYDKEFTASRATYHTRSEHRQLVDAAIAGLPDGHRFGPGDRPLTDGHLQQLQDLLTLTEFAGLRSAEEIESRLQQEGLDNLGADIALLKRKFEAARGRDTASIERTLRAERYMRVTEQTQVGDAHPNVDVLVIGRFDRLSPVEAAVLEWLTDALPAHAVLPRSATGRPAGVDRAIALFRRTLTERFGLDVHQVEPRDGRAIDSSVLESYYTPGSEGGKRRPCTVQVRAPMDVGHEVRFLIRRAQAAIQNEGYAPDDIGLFVTSSGDYLDRIESVAAERSLPVHLTQRLGLEATKPGAAVDDLLELVTSPTDMTALTAALSNPVVELEGYETELDSEQLAAAIDAGADIDDQALEPECRGLVEAILSDARAANGATEASPLTEFLASMGLSNDRLRAVGSRTTTAAWGRIERTITDVSNCPIVDTTEPFHERLYRALGCVDVDVETGPESGSIDVRSLNDIGERTYDMVFIAGLTESGYPTRGRRLAFTRELNEAHPDFDRADPTAQTDHGIATLLAAAETAVLTRPRMHGDGNETIPAGFVTELLSRTAIEERELDEFDRFQGESSDVEPIGSVADTWRALGVLGGLEREILRRGLDEMGPVLDVVGPENGHERLQTVRAGIKTATARATARVDARNGHLGPAAGPAHAGEPGETISPSELNTYAECGFKHLMEYRLEITDDDADMTGANQGTIIHTILEEFYTGIQDSKGTPVDLAGHDLGDLESRLLDIALATLDTAEELDLAWKQELLAGLGTAEANPHYNPWDLETPIAGALKGFLDEELSLRGALDDGIETMTTVPTHFESHQRTTIGGVETSGVIDRIDTGSDGFVIRDYKTGSVPSAEDILGGLAFQLPIYLLLARGIVPDTEPIGGTYYAVGGPGDVSSWRTVLAADDDAVYYQHGGGPVRRLSAPVIETREVFHEYLEATIPEQLRSITASLEAGHFNPAINDPGDAGCSYCEYRDICDVRESQRHDLIESLENTDTAYVPPAARGEIAIPTPGDGDTGGDR
ncbi:PD-(D/E)XK nuclease family protein [Haloarcula laminariae]|uniref:PD-(D/E)XK nuclease family protein n=1 Tax=Haloarcula laminariae TaxID=2961577 RepID=UPI0021C7190D